MTFPYDGNTWPSFLNNIEIKNKNSAVILTVNTKFHGRFNFSTEFIGGNACVFPCCSAPYEWNRQRESLPLHVQPGTVINPASVTLPEDFRRRNGTDRAPDVNAGSVQNEYFTTDIHCGLRFRGDNVLIDFYQVDISWRYDTKIGLIN